MRIDCYSRKVPEVIVIVRVICAIAVIPAVGVASKVAKPDIIASIGKDVS